MSGIGKGSAVPVVTASQGENAMISYLGRINYNYASKYYVTASMRTDGSSKFAPGNRWGYFPSGSLAWAFGRENFVSDALPWLSNGKLRLSWGLTGNNRIGDFDYMAQLVTSSNVYKYPWDSTFYPGYYVSSIANPNLKWETTEQYDFGLDLGFLDGRLNLNIDYYIKTTKDLLMNARCVQKHNLSALHIRIHGLDAVSGRLRLVRRDSNLLTDQMIHQRRFSHIRSSYNRHKSGFKIIFHRSPHFCTVFPAPHQVRLSSVSNICFSDVSTSSLPITHRLPSESTDAIRGFRRKSTRS